MVKLLFDLECTQPLNGTKRHGGGIYGEIVFRKLVELGANVVAFYDENRWLNPEMANLCKNNNIELIPRNGRSLKDLYEAAGAERIYCAVPWDEFSASNVPNKYATIHDVRPVEVAHDPMQGRYYRSLKQRLKMWVKSNVFASKFRRRYRDIFAGVMNSSECVTISQHTSNALKVWFPEMRNRQLQVFYSPSTERILPLDDSPAADYNYFLMVSGNRPEKNPLRAIMAFERLFDNGLLDGMKVHITGLKSLGQLRYRFRHPERFIALGYVSDEELQRQYRDAYAFVYPTLSEGFGYPPLEAMRFETPVAASGVTSVPEVCGDAAVYFNPLDIPEIANRILQLADNDVRKQLIEKGKNRYAQIKAKQDADLELLAKYLMQ